jgi:hypothetical protein
VLLACYSLFELSGEGAGTEAWGTEGVGN